MNILKTGILLTFLTLLLVFIGRLIGGPVGMVTAFIIALIINGVSYWFSDRIVLAMYHAKEALPDEAPQLYQIVVGLAQKANLPLPRVYIIPSQTPNAFATGRNPRHAAVAVTKGILNILDHDELEGVLAHELAHIRNRDILVGSVAATIAGAIFMLSNIARFAALFGGHRGSRDRGGGIIGLLVMTIVAPIAAMLIQMAISRSREYQADNSGGRLSGQPLALASALKKLHSMNKKIPIKANPSTAHMFIVSPLTGGGLANLFSTHPRVENRIEALKRLDADLQK